MECRVCRETIKDGASKCTHCDSFQKRWRSFFNFSSLVLSLLIALIAVTTAGIPVFKSLKAPKASVRYEILSCKANEVRIIAVNSGNSLAVVKGGVLKKLQQEYPLTIVGEVPVMTPDTRHADFRTKRSTQGDLPASGCDRTVELEFSAPGGSLDVQGIKGGACPC